MTLISKAKTGTGRTIQVIGYILWFVMGLISFVWTLYVLFSIFGIWTIFVGLILAPVTYAASFFIVWFSTHHFPFIMLAPYLISWVGLFMASIGGNIAGDD